MKIYVSVKTKEQLKAVRESGRADNLIAPLCLAREISSASDVWIALPDILRENSRGLFENSAGLIKAAKGAVLQNTDEIALLKSIGYEGKTIAGEFLYSYNSEAVNFYRSIFPGMGFIAPAELTDAELSRLEKASGVNFIYKVYGRQKLMTTAQRLIGPFTDEKKEKYLAVYDSVFEYSEIYTGKPVSMLDKKQAYEGRDILFEFVNEDAKETSLVLETMACADYIRGHHYKGID